MGGALADLGVDPDRIVGAGGSSGGHLAASAATVEVPDPPGEEAAVSPRPTS